MLPKFNLHPSPPEVVEIGLDLFGRMMIAAGDARPPTPEEPAGGGPASDLMLPKFNLHPSPPEVVEIGLDLFGRMMIAAGDARPPTHEEPAGGGPAPRESHHRHPLPLHIQHPLHLLPWFMVRGSWFIERSRLCSPVIGTSVSEP